MLLNQSYEIMEGGPPASLRAAEVVAEPMPGKSRGTFDGKRLGIGLWVFALYVMAHLIARLPAFFDFIPLAWASFGGHVIFGLVVGLVVKLREERAA
jgi:hypothetical protein